MSGSKAVSAVAKNMTNPVRSNSFRMAGEYRR
jgi:hypothetical protein